LIFKIVFQKSFQRDSFFDWSPYTHLNLRLRGDGRSYLINIHVSGQFDIMWNDVFTFVLYTRGGPYWQTTRVSNNNYQLTSHLHFTKSIFNNILNMFLI